MVIDVKNVNDWATITRMSRARLNLKREDFAKLFPVTAITIGNWENSLSVPGGNRATKILQLLENGKLDS